MKDFEEQIRSILLSIKPTYSKQPLSKSDKILLWSVVPIVLIGIGGWYLKSLGFSFIATYCFNITLFGLYSLSIVCIIKNAIFLYKSFVGSHVLSKYLEDDLTNELALITNLQKYSISALSFAMERLNFECTEKISLAEYAIGNLKKSGVFITILLFFMTLIGFKELKFNPIFQLTSGSTWAIITVFILILFSCMCLIANVQKRKNHIFLIETVINHKKNEQYDIQKKTNSWNRFETTIFTFPYEDHLTSVIKKID